MGLWIGLGLFVGIGVFPGVAGESARTHRAGSPGVSVSGGVDTQRMAAVGIRRLEGKHLTLYTDVGPDPEVDVLPEVFDQAFEPWCSYFVVDPDEHRSWRMTGRLMRDPDRFRRAGLLPEGLPKFANGFTHSHDFWIYEQPSAYYRRHLMLHEGVHGFMLTLLGSCGPTWYMEGVAELLATHRWEEGRLLLKYFPRSSEEVPMWGRVKIVRQAADRRGLVSAKELIQLVPQMGGENELYGWCWALATFLDNHPRYQSSFRQMVSKVRTKDFTEQFFRTLGETSRFLEEEWALFVEEMTYGYDIERCAIEFLAGQPIPPQGAHREVQADRGWQSSGWQVEAGRTYRLTASGRYQVAQQPRIWWCEPGGVTIRYYRGRPLGMLLAAIRPEQAPSDSPARRGEAEAFQESSSPKIRSTEAFGEKSHFWGLHSSKPSAPTGLLHPIPIGLEATVRPEVTGTLYFRINESPSQLYDNQGSLVVRIKLEE